MTEPFDLNRSIFEDCPDDLGEQDFHFGLLVVGMGSMEGVEVARAFAVAGDCLLDTALKMRETWEAAYPILFCYRHALELYLKAVIPEDTKKTHGLSDLWAALRPHLERRYRPEHVTWLRDRIMEFHNIDPRATAFRYHDSRPQGDPELWCDLDNLKRMVEVMFRALEHIRLASFRQRRQ